MKQIKNFHNQVLMEAAATKRREMHTNQLTLQDFRRRLGLDPVHISIVLRQLRWVGHIVRLGKERWGFKLLKGWLRPEHELPSAKGPKYCPFPSTRYQLWQRIRSIMVYSGAPGASRQKEWSEIVQDRRRWRGMIAK
eukprot:273518-Pyramimonas_sp.AAC.2